MSKSIYSALAFDLRVQESLRYRKYEPQDHIIDLSFSIVDVEDASKVFGTMKFRLVPLLNDECDAFTIADADSESLVEALSVVSKHKSHWFSGEDSPELTPPFLVYIDFVAVDEKFKETILGEAAATMALEHISDRFFDKQDMYTMPVVWDTDRTFSVPEGYQPPQFYKFSNIRKGNVVEHISENIWYSFVPNFSPKLIADYSEDDIERTRRLGEIKEHLSEKGGAEDWAKKMKSVLHETKPQQKNRLAL